MQKARLILLLFIFGILANACHKTDGNANNNGSTRSFYMGVTPWPADFTTAELDTAYDFINQHCDIVSHHFDDGIPYDEAFNQAPMPAGLVSDVQTRISKTGAGKKKLLSVSALNLTRKAKADYYSKDPMADSIKKYWLQIPFNDARNIAAYVNYIGFLINQIHPDFVNYAVESNNLTWDTASFRLYKDFISKVYPKLKTQFPGIPFFASFMVDESNEGLDFASQLLPYTDYIGLSSYPYITISSSANGNTDPSLFPSNYYERFIGLDLNKPFLFAETGYIAKNLVIPSFKLNKQGTALWQRDYLEKICALCNSHQAKMLIWFCSKDYDAGDATLQSLGLYNETFGLWQDIGLKNSAGAGRASYQSWLNWMAMPKN